MYGFQVLLHALPRGRGLVLRQALDAAQCSVLAAASPVAIYGLNLHALNLKEEEFPSVHTLALWCTDVGRPETVLDGARLKSLFPSLRLLLHHGPGTHARFFSYGAAWHGASGSHVFLEQGEPQAMALAAAQFPGTIVPCFAEESQFLTPWVAAFQW